MKDSTITSQELDLRVRKVVLRLSKRLRNSSSHRSCLDSNLASHRDLPTGVKFKSKKFKWLIGYLILLHYYPMEESVRAYTYLDLQDFIEESASFWLTVLTDRDRFLKYLEIQEVMTEQQFFSGICNEANLEQQIQSICFLFEDKFKRPRRIQRRKGYRDKGSLGPEDSRVLRKEEKNDFYLSWYHWHLEEKREIHSQEVRLFQSFLDEGRVLTDEQLIKFHIKKGEYSNEQERESREEAYLKQRAPYFFDNKERKSRKNN